MTAGRREQDHVTATVMVVDDSRAIRAIMVRTLAEAGFRTQEAGNGADALRMAQEEPPDLFLLDIDMPQMDGLSTLRALQERPLLAGIPVVFLTASSGGEDAAEGLSLGARDFIRKPCHPRELLARVQTLTRLHTQEKQLQQRMNQLQEQSTMDTLTGLKNRRWLDSRIERLLTTAPPRSRIGTLLLDIDHFKAVNDEYGHPAGDKVLQIAAKRLETAAEGLRVIRWGGEEFMLVIEQPAPPEDEESCARVREALGRTPMMVGPRLSLEVTASAGYARGVLEEFHQVAKSADEALYQAKQSGRNRLVVSPGD